LRAYDMVIHSSKLGRPNFTSVALQNPKNMVNGLFR
jgi:hypothetical protein